MKKITILLLLISLAGCSEKSNLQEEFICATKKFSNTEEVSDFKNKFSITYPKKWKTQLYFDSIQTQIITADTTRNFTDTYTINIEYNSGDLELNEKFRTGILTELSEAEQQVLKSKTTTFKGKPCFWTISKGKKATYDYFYFELFMKQNKLNYFKITSEVYGNTNIDTRFCESIAIIETLKFLD